MKNNVAVIGNGKIGKIIASLLKSEYFNVTVADQDISGGDCIPIDASDEKQIEHFLKGKDVVVSAAPYFLNKKIAYVASKMGVAYFD